jgi:hypothetical protein
VVAGCTAAAERLLGGGFSVDETYRDEVTMRSAMPGTNMTIFLLFFSLSLLEAVGSRNWVMAALWFALGILFARADVLKR